MSEVKMRTRLRMGMGTGMRMRTTMRIRIKIETHLYKVVCLFVWGNICMNNFVNYVVAKFWSAAKWLVIFFSSSPIILVCT